MNLLGDGRIGPAFPIFVVILSKAMSTDPQALIFFHFLLSTLPKDKQTSWEFRHGLMPNITAAFEYARFKKLGSKKFWPKIFDYASKNINTLRQHTIMKQGRLWGPGSVRFEKLHEYR